MSLLPLPSDDRPDGPAPAPFAVGPGPLANFGSIHAFPGSGKVTDPRALAVAALARNTGDRRWRGWKESQLGDIAECIRETPRLTLLDVSLDGDFNAILSISTPVPRWPRENCLRVAGSVVVHLNYQSHWLTDPPPPWMPAGLLWPFDIFLPNARPAPRGDLCLGAVAPGTPVLELLLLTYYAVSLQTATLDETEGVMNPLASEFYRQHPELLPLTRTGLQEPWSPAELPVSEALQFEGDEP
jgi:hypothetical protein